MWRRFRIAASESMRVAQEDEILRESASVEPIGALLVEALFSIDVYSIWDARRHRSSSTRERESGIGERDEGGSFQRGVVAAAQEVTNRDSIHSTTEAHGEPLLGQRQERCAKPRRVDVRD